MMFLFKKIIAPFFSPVPLCLELLLLGLFFLWLTSKQRLGKILTSLGVLLLLLFSNKLVSDRLLLPLEYRFLPLKVESASGGVRWIVILGGGNSGDIGFPANTRLSQNSLMRLIEGVRIYRETPGSKLLVSGGSVFGSMPDAKVMVQVAESIGIPHSDLVLESHARDTEEETRLIKPIVRNDKFILVTSASHMARSVNQFRKLGIDPIPAPTDYYVKQDQSASPSKFFPNSGALRKTERAFHEYLGLAWAELRL